MNKVLKIHARPAAKIVADLSRRRIPADGLLKRQVSGAPTCRISIRGFPTPRSSP